MFLENSQFHFSCVQICEGDLFNFAFIDSLFLKKAVMCSTVVKIALMEAQILIRSIFCKLIAVLSTEDTHRRCHHILGFFTFPLIAIFAILLLFDPYCLQLFQQLLSVLKI